MKNVQLKFRNIRGARSPPLITQNLPNAQTGLSLRFQDSKCLIKLNIAGPSPLDGLLVQIFANVEHIWRNRLNPSVNAGLGVCSWTPTSNFENVFKTGSKVFKRPLDFSTVEVSSQKTFTDVPGHSRRLSAPYKSSYHYLQTIHT